MRKDRLVGYHALLHLLNEHPEFNAFTANPCDKKIISFGRKMWEKWSREEANQDIIDYIEEEAGYCPDELRLRLEIKKPHPSTIQIMILLLKEYTFDEVAMAEGCRVSQVQNVYKNWRMSSYLKEVEPVVEDAVPVKPKKVDKPKKSAKKEKKPRGRQSTVKFPSDKIIINMLKKRGSIRATADHYKINESTFRGHLRKRGIDATAVIKGVTINAD